MKPYRTTCEFVISGLLVALLGLLLAPGASLAGADEGPEWWDGAWPFRKMLQVKGFGQRKKHGNSAKLWLYTGPRSRPDGGDIRIVGHDGKTLPYGIRRSTPEGKHLVVFQLPDKASPLAVYFGNKAAPTPPQTFPNAGLVLETRPIPKGAKVKDWPAARRVLNASRTVYGLDYWPRVFDAYNPWGPQKDYISLYRGSILCEKPGNYRFATMSQHSSFLLVDDRLVTQWVGKHDIQKGRKGEHSGRVNLSRGRHSFTYVHFAFGKNRQAAAAWIPPGENWWEIMPPSAFSKPLDADVIHCERFDGPVCADFAVRPESYCESGDARMVAMRFESQSFGESGQIEHRWNFGDGQGAAGATPGHVYFSPGVYDVTLTVSGPAGRDRLTQKVRVEPIRDDLEFDQEKLDKFADSTRNYALEKLPTGSLLAAREFFENVEQHDRAFRAALELDRRRDSLRPPDVYEVALYLAKRLQKRGDHPRAQRYFRLALQNAGKNRSREFDARCLLGEHYFTNLNRPDAAREQYRTLRQNFPDGDPERRRKALIRIGDIHRNRGELKQAREAYAKAAGEKGAEESVPEDVLEGRYSHDVESYLREGKGQKALETAEEWLWRFPMERLEGHTLLLKVRAWLLLGDYRRAREQAELYTDFVSDADHLAPLHVAAGEACLEMGLSDRAREHFGTVLNKYPESPSVTDAKDGMARLGG